MSTTRYAAFLRAINVGGRVVRMSDLAARIAALGFRDVRTFIQSGNVSFTAARGTEEAITRDIEADLLKWLGYPVATMVRPWAALEALVASNPFKGVRRQADSKLYVAFLWKAPERVPNLPFISVREGLELVRIEGREAFVVSTRVSGRFGFPNLTLEQELGVPATSRNWNTVLRMVHAPAATAAKAKP